MKKIICIGILLSVLCCGLAEAQTDGQTRIAKEERTRYVEDSLLAARLHDSVRLMATRTYVVENYVTNTDSRLSDSRTPTGTAGGDLTGTYPNPTIKSSVNLTGSPTATTPVVTNNSNRIATTAYVKGNLTDYIKITDSRLSDSRTPTGTAGGDLIGTYPNPTIKSSVNLTGSPTATTPATSTNSTRIATTAYVKNNLANYITTSDNRLTDSRTPTGTAGGDLTGTYPNPTIKSSVNLTGSPTAPTPATSTNNTQLATTAYVKSNLASYVTAGDKRLSARAWLVNYSPISYNFTYGYSFSSTNSFSMVNMGVQTGDFLFYLNGARYAVGIVRVVSNNVYASELGFIMSSDDVTKLNSL